MHATPLTGDRIVQLGRGILVHSLATAAWVMCFVYQAFRWHLEMSPLLEMDAMALSEVSRSDLVSALLGAVAKGVRSGPTAWLPPTSLTIVREFSSAVTEPTSCPIWQNLQSGREKAPIRFGCCAARIVQT